MTLANNPCLDFGPAGLGDTRAHLESAGIGVLGAGGDLGAARRPLIREPKGLRIGVVAAQSSATISRRHGSRAPGSWIRIW